MIKLMTAAVAVTVKLMLPMFSSEAAVKAANTASL